MALEKYKKINKIKLQQQKHICYRAREQEKLNIYQNNYMGKQKHAYNTHIINKYIRTMYV